MMQELPSNIEFLKANEQAFIKDLVDLTSVDCGTNNKNGVDQVGSWVSDRAKEWGWDVVSHPSENYGNCLSIKMYGQGNGKIFMLAHMDTVYPDGTVKYRPTRIEGNKIIGPGVSDMKSGLLSGLYAMRALQENGFSDFKEIILFCNSDEEISSPYSHPLFMKEAEEADAILVLEPARENGDIVSSRKGIGHFTFKVQGKAAHAGIEPEKGINAITEIAHLIVGLDSQIQEIKMEHPGISLNPGVISGGIKSNIVPDTAHLEIDVRVANPDEQKIVQRLLDQSTNNRTNPKTSIQMKGEFTRPAWPKTPATAFLVELAISAAQEVGIQLNDTMTGGSSDANNLSELNNPVLDGLGPVGGNNHSPDEYVLKNSIIPRTIILMELIKSIVNNREKLASLKNT